MWFRRYFSQFCDTLWLPFCRLLAARKATGFFLMLILTGTILAYSNMFCRIVSIIASAVFSVFVFLLAYRKRFWYAVFLPVLTGILFSSFCSLLLFDGYTGSYQALAREGSSLHVRAEVTEVVYTNVYSGRYICRVTGDGLPYHLVIESESPDFTEGEILTGEVQLRLWEEIEDGFDEEQYYLAKGVVSAAKDISLRSTGETRRHFGSLFRRWNQYLSDRISAHVKNDGLPLAMLLGNRDGLTDMVRRDFGRLGILHLIAVSGTHFSMLASFSEMFMIRLRIRPSHRIWILGILTILYMFLTGLTASVRRAGLMFLITLLCRKLELKVRYFSSLNIACGLILLADPFAVLDMGLHLSYLAVCGCILAIYIEKRWPALQKLKRIPPRTDENGKRLPAVRGIRRFLTFRYLAYSTLYMLLMNLVITGLTLPLQWLYFGELSLLSPISNLLYIPLTGIMLFLTLLYLLLYPLGIPVVPLAGILSGFAGILEWPASVLSPIPHVTVSLQYPFIPLFLIPLAISVSILPVLRRKLHGIAAILSIFLIMCGSIFLYNTAHAGESTAVYRNDRVKDGFVLASGCDVLLVDISDGSKSFTNQLLSEAGSFYATELEGYMLTHYHNRHVGTLQDLSDNWILRHLYLPEPVTEEEIAVFDSLLDIAAEKNIETIVFQRDTEFGHFQIHLADRVYLSRSTHPVTGMVVTAGSETLIYASSSVSQGDPSLLTDMASADICVFGAHSPVYKKTFALSQEKQPKVCVWNGDSAFYYKGILPAAGLDLYNTGRFLYHFPDLTE